MAGREQVEDLGRSVRELHEPVRADEEDVRWCQHAHLPPFSLRWHHHAGQLALLDARRRRLLIGVLGSCVSRCAAYEDDAKSSSEQVKYVMGAMEEVAPPILPQRVPTRHARSLSSPTHPIPRLF